MVSLQRLAYRPPIPPSAMSSKYGSGGGGEELDESGNRKLRKPKSFDGEDRWHDEKPADKEQMVSWMILAEEMAGTFPM